MEESWLEDIETAKSDCDNKQWSIYQFIKDTLRHESSKLRQSKATAAILIEFWIDWCMEHAKNRLERNEWQRYYDTTTVMTTYQFWTEKNQFRDELQR